MPLRRSRCGFRGCPLPPRWVGGGKGRAIRPHRRSLRSYRRRRGGLPEEAARLARGAYGYYRQKPFVRQSLAYLPRRLGKAVLTLCLADLDAPTVLAFLDHLESV